MIVVLVYLKKYYILKNYKNNINGYDLEYILFKVKWVYLMRKHH